MSKRLQVLLPDSEMQEIRRIARRHRLTVGEWVRQVLRAAQDRQPAADPGVKLKAARQAAEGSFPTAEIEQMLAEIERGYNL